MKKSKLFVLIALVIIIAVMAGCAKKETDPTKLTELGSRKNVVMDTHAGTLPFEFIVEKGVVDNLGGIDIEVGLQISKDLGKTLTLNNVSLQSVIVEVASQRADFGITTNLYASKDNKENLDFSNPFYVSKAQILVKQNSFIKGRDSYKDAVVGVVKNYKEAEIVKKYAKADNLTVKEFDKASDAVSDLKSGKLDAIVVEQAAAAYYQSQDQNLRIVDLPQVFPADAYVVAVRKGDTELLNKINDSIKKMIENKSIDNWVVKYYN